MKLTEATNVYYSCLKQTPFEVEEPHGNTVKKKIEKEYGSSISFVDTGKEKGKYHGLLMFSSSNDIGTAVLHAYRLASKNQLLDSAMFLRTLIRDGFKESDPLRWPITANDLEELPDQIPSELSKFLLVLFTGCASPYCSERVARVVDSISQDICRATTCNRWKLSKHIILSMALHHMFRSRKLNDLVSRMGHCESYDFALELETEIADATDASSDILSTKIIRNPQNLTVFHSDFDNFDVFVNKLSGAGSVHTAHGIMLQDVCGDEEGLATGVELPVLPKINKRSYTAQEEELPACYMTQRKGPSISAKLETLPGNTCQVIKGK